MNVLDDIILWEIGLCDDRGRLLPDRHPFAPQIRARAGEKLADVLQAVAHDGAAIAAPEPRVIELVKEAAASSEPWEDSLEETIRAVRWAVDLHRRLRAVASSAERDVIVTKECAEVKALLAELAAGARAYEKAEVDSLSRFTPVG